MSTREIPAMAGAHIPPETSARAWQNIAEDRLAGLEMWKERATKYQKALNQIKTVCEDNRSESSDSTAMALRFVQDVATSNLKN